MLTNPSSSPSPTSTPSPAVRRLRSLREWCYSALWLALLVGSIIVVVLAFWSMT